MRHLLVILGLFLVGNSLTSQNLDHFTLRRDAKTKQVKAYRDLSIHSAKRGLKTDSFELHIRGEFIELSQDSILIQTMEWDEHNYYKRGPEHDISKEISTPILVKIPVKEITKIYYTRETFKDIMLFMTSVSLVTGLVVSPLVSIEKNGFNKERFGTITKVSLASIPLWVTVGIAFSQKKYQISPRDKGKVWTIEQ